jgi:hypothetical protein
LLLERKVLVMIPPCSACRSSTASLSTIARVASTGCEEEGPAFTR